jgi:hypothetical protein
MGLKLRQFETTASRLDLDLVFIVDRVRMGFIRALKTEPFAVFWNTAEDLTPPQGVELALGVKIGMRKK